MVTWWRKWPRAVYSKHPSSLTPLSTLCVVYVYICSTRLVSSSRVVSNVPFEQVETLRSSDFERCGQDISITHTIQLLWDLAKSSLFPQARSYNRSGLGKEAPDE